MRTIHSSFCSGVSHAPWSLIRTSIFMMSHSLCTHAVMLTVFNLGSTRRQIFWRLASVQYRDSNFESLYQFRILGSQSRKFPFCRDAKRAPTKPVAENFQPCFPDFLPSRDCTDCPRVESSPILGFICRCLQFKKIKKIKSRARVTRQAAPSP